ncbi:MAG: hypothetical protein JO103_13005 [Candidatus Eremiobacteraeota bacterium]|nr:hypothetical protein [Candidatus Eremiobacteraeota bacterium]MBV9409632.1 hypothetical protein [Candidatus Eremiobacteraeota bacterium]
MKRWFGATVMVGMLTAGAANAAAPPKQAEGGAMQRSSVEGCVGAQLFDGVWRVKVLSVDPAVSYNDGTAETGVGVKVQVRNGTAKELAPDETGFSNVNGHGIDLAYADENTVSAVDSGTGLTESLLDKKLPPGAASTVTIYFPYGPDKTAKPDKLLIAVDPHATTNYKHVHYSVKDPSFRIHLSCPPH